MLGVPWLGFPFQALWLRAFPEFSSGLQLPVSIKLRLLLNGFGADMRQVESWRLEASKTVSCAGIGPKTKDFSG